ncbi:hypothetical protein JT358_11535 [Micrococcales bacterium 31B]|nr:hypothetical protein [Micrococcales bacterium 31B]
MSMPRHAARRRVPRAHAADIICALLCAAQGLRYVLPTSVLPVDTPGALVYLSGVIPLHVWGWAWLVAAAWCLAVPWLPTGPDALSLRARAPRLAAIALTSAWAAAYAAWWIVSFIPNELGNPEAWRTAVIYVSIVGLITHTMLPDRSPP